MPFSFKYLLLIGLIFPVMLLSQEDSAAIQLPHKAKPDTAVAKSDSLPSVRPTQRNPGRAALMSAVVPGLGQIYNKKYWKLPIVYGALGTAGYFIISNRIDYRNYLKAYTRDTNYTDGDVSVYFDMAKANDTYQSQILQQERNAVEQSITYMEYSYIAFGIIYFMQIIDASVDAHLFYFDVSDDLSMHVMPTMQYTAQRAPVHGLSLSLTF